jgi:hypothetical protein
MSDGDATGGDADDGVRVWLVERQYDDGGMVTLVYATPDGGRRYRTQFSMAYLEQRSITASRTEPAADLDATPESDRDRYRTEVERVRQRHDPDDEV